jgi:hypothetical protein
MRTKERNYSKFTNRCGKNRFICQVVLLQPWNHKFILISVFLRKKTRSYFKITIGCGKNRLVCQEDACPGTSFTSGLDLPDRNERNFPANTPVVVSQDSGELKVLHSENSTVRSLITVVKILHTENIDLFR